MFTPHIIDPTSLLPPLPTSFLWKGHMHAEHASLWSHLHKRGLLKNDFSLTEIRDTPHSKMAGAYLLHETAHLLFLCLPARRTKTTGLCDCVYLAAKNGGTATLVPYALATRAGLPFAHVPHLFADGGAAMAQAISALPRFAATKHDILAGMAIHPYIPVPDGLPEKGTHAYATLLSAYQDLARGVLSHPRYIAHQNTRVGLHRLSWVSYPDTFPLRLHPPKPDPDLHTHLQRDLWAIMAQVLPDACHPVFFLDTHKAQSRLPLFLETIPRAQTAHQHMHNAYIHDLLDSQPTEPRP